MNFSQTPVMAQLETKFSFLVLRIYVDKIELTKNSEQLAHCLSWQIQRHVFHNLSKFKLLTSICFTKKENKNVDYVYFLEKISKLF